MRHPLQRSLAAVLAVLALAAPAAGQLQSRRGEFTTLRLANACTWRTGSGSPEGVVTGAICDVYDRTDTGVIYTKTSGSGNTGWTAQPATTFATASVSNTTPAFTSPTRLFDGLYALSGALGATDYSWGKVSLTLATSGSAYTGVARPLSANLTISGTQNATADNAAFVALTANSTSGTVSNDTGAILAAVRTVGPSSTQTVVRLDRSVSASASATNSYGLAVSTPSVTGVTNNVGVLINPQTGATTNLQLQSTHSNSGFWKVFTDGNFAAEMNLASTAADTNQGSAFSVKRTYTGGASPANHQTSGFFSAIGDASASITGIDHYGVLGTSTIQGTAKTYRSAYGVYGGADVEGSATTTAFSDTLGGGVFGVVGATTNYGTGTVPQAAGVTAWGGTGAGATFTNMYRFFVPQLYDYAGTVTTHVGLQISDQVTGATGITNNYAIRVATPSGSTGLTATGAVFDTPGASSIADNGGGTAAAATITPATTLIKITCSDTDGCDVTLGESGILDGQLVKLVNVSANVVNFADTAGVSELAGAYAAGQWDTLTLQYVTDRWVELSRANN